MGFRGVPRLSVVPVFPLSSLLSPLFPPSYKWKAFRNHRNVTYWERDEERRKREAKSARRVKKVDLRAQSALLSVPWGSVVVRCARPPFLQSPLPPYAALLTNGRRFETTETLCIGRGRMRWENEKRKSGETRRKGGFEGAVDSFVCSVGFRGVPRLPVVPGLPLSSLLAPLFRPSDKWEAF